VPSVATEVRLPDGTRALTWGLLPDDRLALAEGYERLDAESKYHRFLSVVPHLDEEMLVRLVDEVDGVDHIALVLFVFDQEDVGEPAGVARMVRYPDDPTAADVAVTVLPSYRGRGVATTLLAQLVRERPVGVRRVVTEVAADNDPSLRMLQRLGPTTVTPDSDHVTLHVVVELPPENAA
jgi:ribosomal protein S18 acetylase RimI-like enzyme